MLYFLSWNIMAFTANPLMDLRVTLQNMSSLSSLTKKDVLLDSTNQMCCSTRFGNGSRWYCSISFLHSNINQVQIVMN